MVEHNVILNGRQTGKTFTIMHEINALIVRGRRAEVLVVFPDANYLHWWMREWQAKFHNMPMPNYITIGNRLKIRGRFYSKVYVEDIDRYEHGIWDERLQEVFVSLRSPVGDEEVVYTCTPLRLNQRSHSKVYASKEELPGIIARAMKRFGDRRGFT